MMRSFVIGVLLAGVVAAPGAAQNWQRPGEMQQPRGNWQVPGEIRPPSGPWQQPGTIQTPRGIDAIRADRTGCSRRYTVAGDALFAFDSAKLSADAIETLRALGPLLANEPRDLIAVHGHTDSVGTRPYNQRLSSDRARAVRDWLAQGRYVPAKAAVQGFGFDRPVAPNRRPDGSDDPEGRQRNRRVEVVVDACR